MELHRRWAAAALTLGLLAGASACSGTDDDPAATVPGDPTAQRAPDQDNTEDGAASEDGDAAASPRPGREGASQNPDEPNAGVELPSSAPGPTRLPGLTSKSRPRALAARPWPDQDAAAGRLVTGFPGALGPVPNSRIISSSLSPAGDRLQIALEATTARRPAAVLRTYRIRMARHGIAEKKVRALGGSQAAGFRRGTTSITVTVTPTGSRTSYTVFGVVGATGE